MMSNAPAIPPADPRRPLGITRSFGAVFVGLIVVVLLSLGTDALLRAVGVFPPPPQRMSDSQFMIATFYRVIYSIFGGFVTATVAPSRPMAHALFYGLVGFALSLMGLIATRNMPELGPRWYPVALVLTAIPCAWLGGLMHVKMMVRRERPAHSA